MEDPWDWDVDQVVQALCYRSSPLLCPEDFPKEFLEPTELESILRRNSIGGLALLTDVNNATMREDLEIKQFGHRCTITHLIRLLRRHSAKWLAHHHATTADNYMSVYGGASNVGFEGVPGSFMASAPSHLRRYSPSGPLGSQMAFGPNLRTQSWVQGQAGQASGDSANPSAFGLSRGNMQHTPSLPPPNLSSTSHSRIPEDSTDASKFVDAAARLDILHNDEEQRAKSETTVKASQAYEPRSYTDTRDRRDETVFIDENGRKRRKLALISTEPVGALHTNLSHEAKALTAILTPPQEDDMDELGGKDGSKIVGDLVPPTTVFDKLSHATVQIEGEAAMANQKALPEPGAITHDDAGRKRMRPVLLSQPEDAAFASDQQVRLNGVSHKLTGPSVQRPNPKTSLITSDYEGVQPSNARTANNNYCGTKGYPVDELFYGTTAFGRPLENEVDLAQPTIADGVVDHPENFVVLSENQVSRGRRLYVNSQLKYFLRSSQHKILRRGNKAVYVIVPYPDKFSRKHRPLSITEFGKTSDGYIAVRRNRVGLDSSVPGSLPKSNDEMVLFNIPEVIGEASTENANNPDFLEKWKYQDSEDEVLPLFGDSGSEGEYDLETWREIENEQGTLTRPSVHSRSKTMADDDVTAAIDQEIKKLQDDWNLKRLPKLQKKAWGLWRKYAQNGLKQQRMRDITATLTTLEARLTGLTNEILGEVWSSEKQIIKQCKILQPTVYDMQDSSWKLSVLKQKKPPEKLQQTSNSPKRKTDKAVEKILEDGEEILSSQQSEINSSEDDLDDFVVDDDDATTVVVSECATMADVEDHEHSGLSDVGGIVYLELSPPPKDPQCTPKQLSEVPLGRPDSQATKEKIAKTDSKPEPVFVDLTQASDWLEPVTLSTEAKPIAPQRIYTPPLKAQDDSTDESKDIHRRSVGFRRPPISAEIIELESDTCDEEELSIDQTPLPSLQDYAKICRLPVGLLEERRDRKRLLIWILSKYKASQRQAALEIMKSMSFHSMQAYIWKALRTYKGHSWRIRGQDTDSSDSLMLIAAFYVCWTIPARLDPVTGIFIEHLETAIADKEGFYPFYRFLVDCLHRFQALSDFETASQYPQNTTSKKRVEKFSEGDEVGISGTPRKTRVEQLSQDLEQSSYATSQKKRKYVVQESQEAIALRSHAQSRTKEIERRRKTLNLRYQKMGLNDEDPTHVIVNPGKEEGQEFIYLNPKIGERIQPHQKEGVQFMWRELTADPKKLQGDNLQGCLLAHTMGLGKTMQVITVLVTIAEAANSSNVNIRQQIPKALRKSQTLVLCPPSLVENWYEEFLMWAPDPMDDNVGDIRKVTSAVQVHQRVHEIKCWRDDGGVLLMGFNTFRELIGNASKRLNDEDHQEILKALLEKPNIIVADEAHTAKNLKSKLNVAMGRFKSTSRIGLTGSPLANNLDEYYALIDWVAPNYLGDHIQFKALYAEPIQQGFYKDSTPADYTESRKRLTALISDLDPKVHRADISVLRGKLKPKTEFLIRLPLTKLQMELYRDYVDWMLGVARVEEPRTATLWAWLSELRLLLNHPKCYKDRLMEKLGALRNDTESLNAHKQPKKKGKSKKRNLAETGNIASDDEAEILDAAAKGPQVPISRIEKQLSIIKQMTNSIGSPIHAYKTEILDQILVLAKEASDKTLVFSHSIKTLDYVQNRLRKKGESTLRIDGSVDTSERQSMTKDFNSGSVMVGLISTRAGGQGLNLFGANRVVILDTSFNPIWEEQAIGRAYRIGQTKPVHVYRLTIGGTFEEALLNQSVFKQQLATRVVDKKNPMRYATRGAKQYLFQPKDLEQKDLASFIGKDPLVLDRLLNKYEE